MSKTAQRKRSAYQMGFTIGRDGWPEGVKSVRVAKVADGAWRAGLAHGRLARRTGEKRVQIPRTFKWWQRIKKLVPLI